MNDVILQKQGANFYGFESINSSGKHRFHFTINKGNGNFQLTKNGVYFKQWISNNGYFILLDKITNIQVKPWHNMKFKWPGKVLRIYFQDGDETKIFGVSPGGELSISKGWKDDSYLRKEEIESLQRRSY